jgi:thymidylate synthase
MYNYEGGYPYVHRSIGRDLAKVGKKVEVETWHAMDVKDQPHLVSTELRNVNLAFAMPETQDAAEDLIKPQIPWAEDHFQERISGEPLNPPPSADYWLKPGEADKHRKLYMIDGSGLADNVARYSHSYPERFWPKNAGPSSSMPGYEGRPRRGVRFEYGDLTDLLQTLAKNPLTRQAYLPVWFPEDLAASVLGERVPCTLGYHFMIRQDQLYVTYMIRSCDYVRHFADDAYLAVRLAQHVLLELSPIVSGLGYLTMHVMSMHAFEGDMPKLRRDHGVNEA